MAMQHVAARAGRAPDLQDRHPHHHPRASIPAPGATFTDHSAEVYAGWCNAAKGMDAWGCQAAAFGNLWKATAEINESLFPHVQWSRDYRTDSGGPGPVAGPLRQPLPQGGPGPQPRLHLRRRHEVPDARHRRRRRRASPTPWSCGPTPTTPTGSPTPPTGCPWRRATSCSTTTAAGAAGAIPWTASPEAVLDDVLDEYVSVGGRRARLRRRAHGVARGPDPRGRRGGDGRAPGRAARLSLGVPDRRRRRGHVHRSDRGHAHGRGRAGQDPLDPRRPVPRRHDRPRPVGRAVRAVARASCVTTSTSWSTAPRPPTTR